MVMKSKLNAVNGHGGLNVGTEPTCAMLQDSEYSPNYFRCGVLILAQTFLGGGNIKYGVSRQLWFYAMQYLYPLDLHVQRVSSEDVSESKNLPVVPSKGWSRQILARADKELMV